MSFIKQEFYVFNKPCNDDPVKKRVKFYLLLKSLVKDFGNPTGINFDGDGFILGEPAEVLRSL